MNILCCFKISPDYDKVVAKDWKNAQPPAPDTSYVPKQFGCYDEAGLETALRLRDSAEARGRPVTVTAVTVGNGKYDYFARVLFALGVQRVVRITLPEPVDFQPEAVSAAICNAFPSETFDAVVCGVQSAEGGGMTPYLLARKLGIPCLPNVTALRCQETGIRVTRETQRGESEATVTAPAVYAVGNSKSPYLRLSTVKKRMSVSQMHPETIALENLPAPAPEQLSLLRFTCARSGRACVFVAGDTCAQKAENLLKLCPEVRKV